MSPLQIHRRYTPFDFVFCSRYIETGTSAGDGVQRAIDAGFSDIRSVELSDHYYEVSRRRFQNVPTVKLWHGKSADCLANMISDVSEPSVFFLDAHPAGPHTAGHDDLMARGEMSEFHQHHIITSELAIIASHPIKTHFILIDDQTQDQLAASYMQFVSEFISSDYTFYFTSGPENEHATEFLPKILVCSPIPLQVCL